MTINKSYSINKGLYPRIYYLLEDIPDDYYFGKMHLNRCRPPNIIFSIASHEFLESMFDIIESINTLNIYSRSDHRSPQTVLNILNKQLPSSIAHLCSFYDELFLILKSITYEKNHEKKEAASWLRDNKIYSGNQIKGSCYSAIAFWYDINNRIKHNNQRFNSVEIIGEEYISHGFYLEGVKEDGKPYIDTDVHNKIRNSFGVTFQRAICHLFTIYFFIAHKFEKTIINHLKKEYNFKLGLNYIAPKKSEDRIQKIWESITNWEMRFFPSEYGYSYSKISFNGNSYMIRYPITINQYTIPFKMASLCHSSGNTIPLVNVGNVYKRRD